MSFEEDTYTTIFKAMQHPVRRRILRSISEHPSTYTEIQRELNIDNGLLNYHLDALSSLITKDLEEKYTLSDFGRATVSLVKGIEEPEKSRTTKVASTPRSVKVLAVVAVLSVIVSSLAYIELNNRYIDLSGKYGAQGVENTYIKSSLTEAQSTISKLNATITTLESDPLVQAATMIIDRVGIDYFNTYFHDPQVIPFTGGTQVIYKYKLSVGNYTTDSNVTLYIFPKYVDQYGTPSQGNLQPFKVSKAEAIRLALDAGLPSSSYGIEASIQWTPDTDVVISSQNLPYADKYLWEVTSWSAPLWATSRTFKEALVDPITGSVYVIRSGGRGLVESQVDTPDKAAAKGIDGYVKLEYPQLVSPPFPMMIQIVKGSNLTITIKASFISYNTSLREVKLVIDPHYVDPYGVQSNMADKLRDVLTFEPSGIITLGAGESINIKATVVVPRDSDFVFQFPYMYLEGLGIGSQGILVLTIP